MLEERNGLNDHFFANQIAVSSHCRAIANNPGKEKLTGDHSFGSGVASGGIGQELAQTGICQMNGKRIGGDALQGGEGDLSEERSSANGSREGREFKS